MLGPEEGRAGAVLDDDQESDVAGPGDDPGDGAGGAVAGGAEALRSERGDQTGLPVHAAHQLVQNRRPGGALVATPALLGDQGVDAAQGLELVEDDPPSGVDEVPPPGVRRVAVASDPLRGAAAAGGQSAGEPSGDVSPDGALAWAVLDLPRRAAPWRP
ncbi:hypothetical protein I4I73_05595 [Pseudonocardia sp. KRD-184]|uniref:hypothetical protein n=1 Tax=Pseudonocardia oceani TaxID=2792013 RepID=UPI001C49F891|nr:hypothetical protein [Pseudonocardia oceani]MBW0088626.1 hypothetical protein [Pseudonocardia oceani]MBW0095469.1 hypothetical protein [Pseudonocardia oceani]